MIDTTTLETAIKKNLWSFYSTDAHNWTSILRYINSAVRYIVERKNFKFNKYVHILTTNDIDTEYSIPYQIETFFVQNNSWEELEILEFENYYREQDKSNKICIFEDKLITTIKWTLNIFYRWYPETLTSVTETLNIPAHFYDVLILIGSYYGFLDVQAYEKANFTKNTMDWFINSLATRSSDKFPLNEKRLNISETQVW